MYIESCVSYLLLAVSALIAFVADGDWLVAAAGGCVRCQGNGGTENARTENAGP